MTRALSILLLTPVLAGAAEPGPALTVRDVLAALPDREAGGTVSGWSLDGRSFGACTYTCGSREEGWEITCALGTIEDGATRARLRPTSLEAFAAAGLRAGPQGTLPTPPGVRIEAGAVLADDRCEWSMRVLAPGGRASVASGRDACWSRVPLEQSVAPGGAAVAAFITYSADHGCGGLDGVVVAWPSAAAEALVRRGLRLHRKKKLADALPHYDAAVALDAEYAPAHYNKACAHALLGQEEAAAAQVRWLLAHDDARFRPKIANIPVTRIESIAERDRI